MRKYTIGCDPEVFLEDKDGGLVNAFSFIQNGMLKGTKRAPEATPYGAIQVDGMAIEFNTMPTEDPKQFSKLVVQGLNDITERLKTPFSNASIKNFELDWLQAQHPLSVELGCDPDYDAWRNGAVNMMGDFMVPYRTAGGHVHIGWGKKLEVWSVEHTRDCIEAIKQMDYVLGLWSLMKDSTGNDRRKLYGKAGAFRPKSYGVEYRVLSNFWIFSSSTAEQVARRAIAGMKAMDDGVWFSSEYGDFAQKAITAGKINDNEMSIVDSVEKVISKYY